MSYLLLLKHQNPGGDTDTSWELWGDLEAARLSLERHKRCSEQQVIDSFPIYRQTGPYLVQHSILNVEEV
jgi:hypothetical protein